LPEIFFSYLIFLGFLPWIMKDNHDDEVGIMIFLDVNEETRIADDLLVGDRLKE